MSSTSKASSLNLDRVLNEQVDWRYKSFPAGPPIPIRAVRERGWSALGSEFMLPFGKAGLRNEGSDVVVITWGALVQRTLVAAHQAEKEGIT